MPRNPIRARWDHNQVALDCWVTGESPATAEAVGRLEVDAVVIDMQHSASGIAAVAASIIALAATGAAPVVRVPVGGLSTVERVLDAGALGVICPMVTSAADAERFAAACRYPPRGTRSFGPWRPAEGPREYLRRANAEILAIAQIESVDALDRVDAIAAVPGIDVLYAGTADLAVSAGEDPFLLGPQAEARVRRVAEAAHAAGKRAGTTAVTRDAVALAVSCGMDLISVALERWLVVDGAAEALARARTELSLAVHA